jgi:hypothetical protein
MSASRAAELESGAATSAELMSPTRCVCRSISPGSTVYADQSMTRLPPRELGVHGVTDAMRPSSIRIARSGRYLPCSTSSMRPARTTTVSADDGIESANAMQDRKITSGARWIFIQSTPSWFGFDA